MTRIKELREEKGMKQSELAKVISVSQASFSGYESGKFEPSTAVYIAIADYFNVSLDYLLCRTDKRCADEPGIAPNADERQLLNDYRALNDDGQSFVRTTVRSLVSSGAYIKTTGIRQIQVS